MDKEIATKGSAFTAFGCRDQRYTDVFDSPLDDPQHVTSFDAEKFRAYPRRSRRRNRATATANRDDGRSLRLGGSDSSSIVLQSLGSGSGPTYSAVLDNQIAAGVPASSGHHSRRYSATQDGNITTTQQSARNTASGTQSDQLLQILTSAFAAPASSTVSSSPVGKYSAQSQRDRIATADGSASDFEERHNSNTVASASTAASHRLTRQNSSPALASLADNQANSSSADTPPAPVTSGKLAQHFLHRTASAGILSSLAGSDTMVRNNEQISKFEPFYSSSALSNSGVLQRAGGNNVIEQGSLASSGPSANLDAPDATNMANQGKHRFGTGVLAHTRRFGAWLGRVTEGEKVEVTKKDLNVFAPTSF